MSSFPKFCLKDITNKHVNIDSKAEDNMDDSQSYFDVLPVSIFIYL